MTDATNCAIVICIKMAVAEKRRFPRLPMRIPLSCTVRGEGACCKTLTSDVSAGGISFVHDRFIPPDTTLMIELTVLNKALTPIGKVVSATPLPYSNRFRHGVEFVAIESEQKNCIRDFVEFRKEGSIS